MSSGTDYLAPAAFKSFATGSSNGYGDANPYSEPIYEQAPIVRELKRYGAGAAWRSADRSVQTAHLMNAATGELSCKLYTTDGNTLSGGSGCYTVGSLYITKTTDEDGNISYTFTDKQGRTVLTRQMNGTEQLDTYFVYDAKGNLCFVLQPMYQTTANLSLYAFQYKYDNRNRCIWKKLPGAEYISYEYNDYDQLTFSQDGNQRANGKWTFYVYDKFNRLTQQGENTSKAVSASGVYLQNYYDNYSYMGSTHFPSSGYNPEGAFAYSKGMLTGKVVSVFGSTEKIATMYHYDIKGRLTKTTENNLMGGYNKTVTTYTFTDQPATVTLTHTANGKLTQTEVYTYSYDHSDRISSVTHKLNNGSAVTLASYTYDNVGRMATKKLHGSSTNQLTYAYNIRSWLTGITSGKFTQNLTYNNGSNGFNGNITAMNWTANGSSHSYAFTYDGMNRMLNATHGTGAYTEKVTGYDKNGNITGLQRYNSSLVDNLTYTYNGNQLTKVEDATGNSNGFANGASTSNEYTYDNNGNLTKDSNKGIASITYNSLNLSQVVTFSNGNTITYLYTADGRKLRTVHVLNGSAITTDYSGNVIYENGSQKLLLTEEGYVNLANSNTYYYYLKDHQGNNRVVINSSGTVQETNHYYPFGGTFALSSVQPYKYNGKELDSKNGLNWYDYGARHYDAALGRWHVVDPLSEKYYSTSPFSYCLNNPLRFIDPDGCDVKPYGEEELAMIRNTLPEEARQFVVLNKNGYIDKETLEDFKGNSANFEALKELVNSKYDISVKLGVSYSYMDNAGNILSHGMNYLEADKYLADEDFQYTNGLTTGEGGNNGVTLLPGKGESGVNSIDDSKIDVIIHQSLSEIGRAETYSHEANGHALMYVRTQNRYKSAHQQKGLTETNIPLREMIINSRKETIKNMR